MSRIGSAAQWFFGEGALAVVALVTGGTALLFTLFPDIKPFTPESLSATVRVVTIERAVTRDQWRWRVAVGDRERHDELHAADLRAANHPQDEPCGVLGVAPGFSIYVATTAEGFDERDLTVRAALYDAETRRRVPDPEQYRALAKFPVEAPTASSVQEVWLYDPGFAPRYFVRVQLYDSKDHLLHIVQSATFRRISGREIAALPEGCEDEL